MRTWKIVKYQLRDVLRSRWILFYVAFFWAVTDVLFRFGGSGERVAVSLMNVVLLVVPLAAIVFGVVFLYNSREYVELLLSQPVRRRSLFAAFYLGLAVPLAAGFVVGVGAPFLYHPTGDGAAAAPLLAVGALLTLVFVALGFLMALLAEDRIKGLSLGLALWLLFAVVYDGLVLTAIVAFSRYPLEKVVVGLALLNPVDLGRVLLLLNFDISALMGYTGAVFQQFFGTFRGQVTTFLALLAWVGAPLLLGWRAFSRKNF